MKYGELIERDVFLNKELFVWQKPPIEKLQDSLGLLGTTEIIKFQIEHLTGMPGFDFWIWVVIDELGFENRNRLICLVKGIICKSVPKLDEYRRYNFAGRLDYTAPDSVSYLKIIE